MNEKPTYYCIKVMHVAESMEIAERIAWCIENELKFFNQGIRGIKIGGIFYEEEEMKEIGLLVLHSDNGGSGEIDLAQMPPINIGMIFAFHNEIDVTAFKLRWI